MDITDAGYCDDTDFEISKKKELLELLKEYDAKLEEFEGYDYITIQNPNKGRALEICFDGGYILFFGGWHGHYDEDEYNDMKEEIFDILNGNLYALAVIEGDYVTYSTLCSGDVSHYSDGMQLLKDKIYSPSGFEKLTNLGGTIEVTFWNPVYSKSFDIVAKSES